MRRIAFWSAIMVLLAAECLPAATCTWSGAGDGTTQTIDWLVVGGIPQPSGTYTKAKAGSAPRLAFLARGEGTGTLFVRKGSGCTIIFR